MPKNAAKQHKSDSKPVPAGKALRKAAKEVIPKGTFQAAGSKVGGLFGPLGSVAGGLLGKGLSSIVGFGDYTVTENSLMSTPTIYTDAVPQFSVNNHVTKVRHREYIRDILVPAVPANFTLTTDAINPGNATIFPWLAPVARQFQEYAFKGLAFEYKTMSSDYAANGPLGTVCLATNYNANDSPFTNKIQMENSEFAVSTKPSHSILHPVECAPRERVAELLYIRDPLADVTTVSDKRFYDWGNLQIATVGLPGTKGQVLGELWVTYEIDLYKPIISPLNSTSTTLFQQVGQATTGSVAWQNWVNIPTTGAATGIIETQSGSTLATSAAVTLLNTGGMAAPMQFNKAGLYTIVAKFSGTGAAADSYTVPTTSNGVGGVAPTIIGASVYANSTLNGIYAFTVYVSTAAVGGQVVLSNLAQGTATASATFVQVTVNSTG